MVRIRIGVVSIQGDVSEHLQAVTRAIREIGETGKGVPVKRGTELSRVDAVVIPGGESTTISKLMSKFGMDGALVDKVRFEDMPVMGTCAGCILLAKEGDAQVKKTKTKLLGLMDMKVDRNAYGRQKDSFESASIFRPPRYMKGAAKGIDFKRPVPTVFIRAPLILKVFGDCRVLAKSGDRIIAAQQGRRLALTFHPELTTDLRVHRYFAQMVKG